MTSVKSSLLPPSLTLSLGGSTVCVSRLTTGQTLRLIAPLTALIDAVSAGSARGITLPTLISENAESVFEIAAESIGWTPMAINKLKGRDLSQLIEALVEVNRDFFLRAQPLRGNPDEDEEQAEGEAPKPMTALESAAAIERLVYDLAAAGACTRTEALASSIADNLALFDAVSRKDARLQLATLDALQSAIAAAFSKEGGEAVARHSRKLARAAGYEPSTTYTGDSIVHL